MLLLLYALLFSFIDKSFNEIACFTLRRPSELCIFAGHARKKVLLFASIFSRSLPFALYIYMLSIAS